MPLQRRGIGGSPEMDVTGMWPQPQELHGSQRSQPPLARSYPAVSVIYCQLERDDLLEFSTGIEQLDWWHDICQETEVILKRYGAVTAERGNWGICAALGLGARAEEALGNGVKSVQCALQLLSSLCQMELPGGARVRAKIGLHCDEASDSLVGCSNTLHYRLCGPAYSVARQLAGCACWGGMLMSEGVWKEQGKYARLWVYNQGVSMPWGPIISCFTLLPEGHAAYTQSAHLPGPVTRGVGMPTMPCHSTAWQVERVEEASASTASSAAGRTPAAGFVQSVLNPSVQGEAPNPFALLAAETAPHASSPMAAEAASNSTSSFTPSRAPPAARAPCASPSPDSLASPALGAQLTGQGSPQLPRPHDMSRLFLVQSRQGSPNSSWSSNSAGTSAAAGVPQLLRKSAGSRRSTSLGTTESLDSASALQPPSLTFAQLLQQQNERAARSRAAMGQAGPAGKLSASHLTSALYALPELSETERIARFMEAMHDSRLANLAMPEHSSRPLSGSTSRQSASRVQERLAAYQLHEAADDESTRSSSCSSGRGGRIIPDIRGRTHVHESADITPRGQISQMGAMSANPHPVSWPQTWAKGKPGGDLQMPLRPSALDGAQKRTAAEGTQLQRQAPWIDTSPTTSASAGNAPAVMTTLWPDQWSYEKPRNPIRLGESASQVKLSEGAGDTSWKEVTLQQPGSAAGLADKGKLPQAFEHMPLPEAGPSSKAQSSNSRPQRMLDMQHRPMMTGSPSALLKVMGDTSPGALAAFAGEALLPGRYSLIRDVLHPMGPAPAVPWRQQASAPSAAPHSKRSTPSSALPQTPAQRSAAPWALASLPGSHAPASAIDNATRLFRTYRDHLQAYSTQAPSSSASSSMLLKASCSQSYFWQGPAGDVMQQMMQQGVLRDVQAKSLPLEAGGLLPGQMPQAARHPAPKPGREQAQREPSRSSAPTQAMFPERPEQLSPKGQWLPQGTTTMQPGRLPSAVAPAGELSGPVMAAQLLSAHDVSRRRWTPGGLPPVSWREDLALAPGDLLFSSSASSEASTQIQTTAQALQRARSAAVAQAQLPVPGVRHPVSGASMAAPSIPAASTPAVPEHAQRLVRRLSPRQEVRQVPATSAPVQRRPMRDVTQPSVWVRLATAFWAKLMGVSGPISITRLFSGKTVQQDATLQFLDAGLEGRFQKKWAHEKGAQDRAVLAFFILVLLCIEIVSPFPGSTIDVQRMLPGLTTVALMSAMLGAMTLRRAWYLEHRAVLQLLLRVFRAICINWQIKQAYWAIEVASGTCSPGRNMLDIIVRSGFPLVVLSLCEGNTMSTHVVGDLLCLLLAAAQAPWLCISPCSLWLQASTTVWLLARALVFIALCSAVLFKTEEASRRAFLKASDAEAAPLLELLHVPAELFDPAHLYLAPSGNIRCGQHAGRMGQ